MVRPEAGVLKPTHPVEPDRGSWGEAGCYNHPARRGCDRGMNRTEFAKNLLKGESWAPTPLLQAQAIGDALGIDLWLKRE